MMGSGGTVGWCPCCWPTDDHGNVRAAEKVQWENEVEDELAEVEDEGLD